jgi:hypothetical protein
MPESKFSRPSGLCQRGIFGNEGGAWQALSSGNASMKNRRRMTHPPSTDKDHALKMARTATLVPFETVEIYPCPFKEMLSEIALCQ